MSAHISPTAFWSTSLKSALVALAASAACHSQKVVPALKCADPCCEGQVTNVDCAENPDLSCLEDADPCVARVYGCTDGSYYLTYPDVTPSTCVDDAAAGAGGLVLGDGGPLREPE
jgi:hypothetical protein